MQKQLSRVTADKCDVTVCSAVFTVHAHSSVSSASSTDDTVDLRSLAFSSLQLCGDVEGEGGG